MFKIRDLATHAVAHVVAVVYVVGWFKLAKHVQQQNISIAFLRKVLKEVSVFFFRYHKFPHPHIGWPAVQLSKFGSDTIVLRYDLYSDTSQLSTAIEIPALPGVDRRVDRPIARASAREVLRGCNPFAIRAERQQALSLLRRSHAHA